MMWHFYEIPYIPDLELVKYQSLGEQGIDGILERHNRFLRQWQRNTVLIHKKNIAFTEFGRDFAEKTVGILRMAELDALAELSPEERELYIRLNEKYNCRLIEKLYRIMDEVNQDRKDCD